MTMDISAADRALIDAAIAAGKVRKIPRGVSGIDPMTGHGWKEIGKAMLANDRRAKRLHRTEKPQPVKVKRAATAEGFKAQLRQMRRDGMTYDQIAASVGMVKSAVWRHCQ
ncbi:MAG: hypothetical protein WA973_00585 [Mesorhizobium sp.]